MAAKSKQVQSVDKAVGVEAAVVSKTVTVAYDEAPNRPFIPVEGAYGGPSPDGNVVLAHVYTEFVTVPSVEELPVNDKGIVFGKGQSLKRSTTTRRVHATLVFSHESARSLGKWLQERADLADEVQARNKVLNK